MFSIFLLLFLIKLKKLLSCLKNQLFLTIFILKKGKGKDEEVNEVWLTVKCNVTGVPYTERFCIKTTLAFIFPIDTKFKLNFLLHNAFCKLSAIFDL